MTNPVRVRFAPSPTGPLHIGGVRTALFNYLFAKKHGGAFVLRIEDTDQSRLVPGAEAYIIDALNWLGITFDEGPGKNGPYGPYRQSDRKSLYLSYAEQLLANGWAYYAFDPPESLENHRKDHEEKGKAFIYNWHNRQKLDNSLTLSDAQLEKRLASNEPFVIRFKWPEGGSLVLKDEIRGEIHIDTNTLDDKVLFKSDGMPTYHLANIVDDHLMEITHVIRGEEWLPSLPLHMQLYKAFGWESPEFAHLPLIMKPAGKGKLSKRDGEKMGFPVFPLSWNESIGYREAGYFPEAVLNFLALLGWNPGTEQELFSKEELIELFDLSRVQKSGARFDPEKNKWYNHQYLLRKPADELLPQFRILLIAKGLAPMAYSDAKLLSAIEMLRERANFVSDMWELGWYLFEAPADYDARAALKQWKPGASGNLRWLAGHLAETVDFESGALEASVKQWLEACGLGFGQVMPPLRLVLVGSMQGPHLFDVMAFIGQPETLARIERGVEQLDRSIGV